MIRVLAPGEVAAGRNAEIADLAYDARRVTPGALFFCVPGSRADGHDFAADVVAAGAVALVVERPLEVDVPQLVVDDARAAMAIAADAFFGEPTRELEVAGVTGTNGKTTTAFLLAVDPGRGGPSARARRDGRMDRRGEHAARRRTRHRRRSTCSGCSARCWMPVTGASRSRRPPTARRCAGSTGCASTRSCSRISRRTTSTCTGRWRTTTRRSDACSSARCRRRQRSTSPTSTGAGSRSSSPRRTARRSSPSGSPTPPRCGPTASRSTRQAAASRPAGIEIETPLRGRFNVENVLGAVAAGVLLDIDEDEIAAGVRAMAGVPGRFEAVDEGQPFAVIVDYAHTPDALDIVLQAARELGTGRVIVVFGAGGDRDRGKRPLMGRVARERSPTSRSSRRTTRAASSRSRSSRTSSRGPAPTWRSIPTGARRSQRAVSLAGAGRRRRGRRQGPRAGPGARRGRDPFDDRRSCARAARGFDDGIGTR